MAAKRASKQSDADSRRAQWLKGILDLCVLSLIGDQARYGYELATRFEEVGLGKVKGGTLYPRLSAMEDQGLLTAEWRPGDGGPGRKYYRVSSEGAAVLAESGADWVRFAGTVAQIVAPADSVPPGGAAPLTVDAFERTV